MADPSEIADRDARRLAAVLREVGGAGAAVGTGWMACDLLGSWADYAAGLGAAGPVEDATLDALVAFYREQGRTPRIQVTPYQHPSLLKGLGARGFVVYEVETVLWRNVTPAPPPAAVLGLTFRAVDSASASDVAAFHDAQMAGFFEDRDPPAGMRPITERVARADRCRLWLLESDGLVVGSGGLEVFEAAAVLIAGCVRADARCRGLHSAFIQFRIQEAARAGLSYVTVSSKPGGPTERNALRAGFAPAYTQLGLHQP